MPYEIGQTVAILRGGYSIDGLRDGDHAEIVSLTGSGAANLRAKSPYAAAMEYPMGKYFLPGEFCAPEEIDKQPQRLKKHSFVRLTQRFRDLFGDWSRYSADLVFHVSDIDIFSGGKSTYYRLRPIDPDSSSANWTGAIPDNLTDLYFTEVVGEDLDKILPKFSVGDYIWDPNRDAYGVVVRVSGLEVEYKRLHPVESAGYSSWTNVSFCFHLELQPQDILTEWKKFYTGFKGGSLKYLTERKTGKDAVIFSVDSGSDYFYYSQEESNMNLTHTPTNSGWLFRNYCGHFEDKEFSEPALKNWGVTYATVRDLFVDYVDWGFSDSIKGFFQNLLKNSQFPSLIMHLYQPKPSTKVAGNIAFYPNINQLKKGIPITIKAGRGLRAMKPTLSDKELEVWVDRFRADFPSYNYQFKMSGEAADFKHAYSHEMAPYENIYTTCGRKSLANSCMRGDRYYHMKYHPAETYASGDFQILWTELENGRIGSRCVVYFPEGDKPQAGPIYGTTEASIDALAEELTKLGALFEQESSWDGARLRYINDGRGIVGPYLDKSGWCTLEGDYLIIGDDGDYEACSYGGYLEENRRFHECQECGDNVDEEDVYTSEGGHSFCSGCYHDLYCRCEHSHTEISVDDSVTVYTMNRTWGGSMRQGELVVHRDYTEDGTYPYCESRGEHWHRDYVVETADGNYEHVDDVGICHETDESYLSEDLKECMDGNYRNIHFLTDNGWVANSSGIYDLPEVEEESEAA